MKFFQKMERKYGRYAIHNLMYYIIILYIAGFVMLYMPGGREFFYRYLSLNARAILHGQVWRLFTFLMYPPTTSPIWIIFAILMYYSLGRSLENVWGAFRFNAFFFSGVLGLIAAEFIGYLVFRQELFLDTTYLNASIFLAYAATFPEEWFYIYFIIAIKAKWLALFDGFFMVIGFVYGNLPTKIAILLAMGNFLIFFFATRDYKKYSPKEVRRRQDFQTQMRPVSRARHRCAVCGRTDEESPGMEFRYCSKCEGNREYCMDHLYTHEHIKTSAPTEQDLFIDTDMNTEDRLR